MTFTEAEYQIVRRLARANGCSMADCLRLGALSVAQEAAGDEPPVILGGTFQAGWIVQRA